MENETKVLWHDTTVSRSPWKRLTLEKNFILPRIILQHQRNTELRLCPQIEAIILCVTPPGSTRFHRRLFYRCWENLHLNICERIKSANKRKSFCAKQTRAERMANDWEQWQIPSMFAFKLMACWCKTIQSEAIKRNSISIFTRASRRSSNPDLKCTKKLSQYWIFQISIRCRTWVITGGDWIRVQGGTSSNGATLNWDGKIYHVQWFFWFLGDISDWKTSHLTSPMDAPWNL